MNRFLFESKLKPEFKMVQLLPALLGIPTAKREFARASEAVVLDFSQEGQPKPSAIANMEPFATVAQKLPS